MLRCSLFVCIVCCSMGVVCCLPFDDWCCLLVVVCSLREFWQHVAEELRLAAVEQLSRGSARLEDHVVLRKRILVKHAKLNLVADVEPEISKHRRVDFCYRLFLRNDYPEKKSLSNSQAGLKCCSNPAPLIGLTLIGQAMPRRCAFVVARS